MPSLGDLTINLRANATQAKREFDLVHDRQRRLERQQARVNAQARVTEQTFGRLARDVRQANAAFSLGKISVDDHRVALQTARREANQFVSRGIVPVGKELTAMNFVMAQTAVKARGARQGLGTIRSAGASLTARLVGLNGTLGTLLSGMSQFAIGNLASIGVIAGFAAIVAGFRAIGKGAREARQRASEAIDKLKEMQRAEIAGGDIARQLASVRARRRALQEEVARLGTGTTRRIRGATGAVLTLPGQPSRADEQKRRELAVILEQEKELERRLTEATRDAANDRIKAMRDLARAAGDAVRREREWQAHLAQQRAFSLRRSRFTPGELATGTIPTFAERNQTRAGRIREAPIILPTFPGGKGAQFLKSLRTSFAAAAEDNEFAGALSRTISRALIEGLLTSRRSFGALLQSIIASALADAASRTIGAKIAGLFATVAATGAAVATGGAAAGAAAGVAGGVSGVGGDPINIMIPPPRSPTDPTRDRDWLNALSASLDNLTAYGRRA